MDGKDEAKARYDKRVTTWKEDLKKFEEESKKLEKHTARSFQNRFVNSRSGDYRENGYFYIGATKKGRRAVYDVPPAVLGQKLLDAGIKQAQPENGKPVPVGGEVHAMRYMYGYSRKNTLGMEHNFFSGRIPYKNQAHHILPVEALEASVFGEEWWQIKKVPYDANHGENIIFLPESLDRCVVHGLPLHNGSHPKYNELVKADIEKVRREVKRQTCDTPLPPPIAVANQLIMLESKYWMFLRTLGKETVNELAEKELKSRADAEAARSGV